MVCSIGWQRTILLFMNQTTILSLIFSNGGRRQYKGFRITRLDETLDEFHLAALKLHLERIPQLCTEQISCGTQRRQLHDLHNTHKRSASIPHADALRTHDFRAVPHEQTQRIYARASIQTLYPSNRRQRDCEADRLAIVGHKCEKRRDDMQFSCLLRAHPGYFWLLRQAFHTTPALTYESSSPFARLRTALISIFS